MGDCRIGEVSMETLKELEAKGYVKDLYAERKGLEGKLFSFAFHTCSEEAEKRFKLVKEMLSSSLPAESNWFDVMFPQGSYHPNLGIYDAENNRLLTMGIGRKHGIFHHCSDSSIPENEPHYDFTTYTDNDPENKIKRISDLLTQAAYLTDELEMYEDDEEFEDMIEKIDARVCEDVYQLTLFIPDFPTCMADLDPC